MQQAVNTLVQLELQKTVNAFLLGYHFNDLFISHDSLFISLLFTCSYVPTILDVTTIRMAAFINMTKRLNRYRFKILKGFQIQQVRRFPESFWRY